mgnify:CR=1 FL=1
MAHHAYFIAGDGEEGIAKAHAFAASELSLDPVGNPDVITFRYDLFSVDDARAIIDSANRMPLRGDKKLIVIGAKRLFHEAQNALLKTFEEPPLGTYLILVVPSEGAIITTLRSRLLALPEEGSEAPLKGEEFLNATQVGREKIIEKILARAKKNEPEEKQAARIEALSFVQELVRATYETKRTDDSIAFLQDLNAFVPILHERSAPLKPILEHLLIAAPKRLTKD